MWRHLAFALLALAGCGTGVPAAPPPDAAIPPDMSTTVEKSDPATWFGAGDHPEE